MGPRLRRSENLLSLMHELDNLSEAVLAPCPRLGPLGWTSLALWAPPCLRKKDQAPADPFLDLPTAEHHDGVIPPVGPRYSFLFPLLRPAVEGMVGLFAAAVRVHIATMGTFSPGIALPRPLAHCCTLSPSHEQNYQPLSQGEKYWQVPPSRSSPCSPSATGKEGVFPGHFNRLARSFWLPPSRYGMNG
jgi:hypothetical protein